MRFSKSLLGIAAAAILITGCASQEEPARAAVNAAEASLDQLRADAAKYAPDELQAAEASLDKAKADLAKENYKEVLAASTVVNQQIATLHEVVVSRQTQIAAATNEWESLNVEVPKMVQAIQSRVDMLSKSRKLPAGVDKASFETVKTELDTMKSTWAEATAAFSAGNATEAADKGRTVQAKAAEVLTKLGMSPRRPWRTSRRPFPP
jgi:hypothetical protein